MKLDCILTACNENPLYMEFIPYFIKVWNKLYPNVDIKIIFIANKIPTYLDKYKQNLILFNSLPNISTAFISQFIRLLYPAILDYENGIMITDIDIVPMNRTYYTNHIIKYDNCKFINFRDVIIDNNQLIICYNVAINKIWSDIFNIKSLEDIKNRLKLVNSKINYVNKHGRSGWATDQIYLYDLIKFWKQKTNNFIMLKDKDTKFQRLCRNNKNLPSNINHLIKNGYYTDYHCLRPYSKYKNINDNIYNLL